MRVRHYGFLANRRRRQRLQDIRKVLGARIPTDTLQSRSAGTVIGVQSGATKERECPACQHGHLIPRYRIESCRLTKG